MNKVWLVKIIATDEATFSVHETIAICTDKTKAIELKKKAQLKYTETVFVEEVETNILIV